MSVKTHVEPKAKGIDHKIDIFLKHEQEKIRAWQKTKPYNQMLRENFIKYSILEHKLLDGVNYS